MDIKNENTEKPCLNIVSPAFAFGPVSWWRVLLTAKSVYFDPEEYFQKMTCHHRFTLTGSQGKQLLSIPLKGGRNQKIKMKELEISYADDWKNHHLKTIKTLYKRSPFFEFFEEEIYKFYEKDFNNLLTFNTESFYLVNHLIGLKINTLEFLNSDKENNLKEYFFQREPKRVKPYHQVFQEKVGFQNDCSILDLLFCEGGYSKTYLL